MKLKLLLFLFTFGISTSVSAEIVLYCISELATGFMKENGIYGTRDFELIRYTLKFSDDYSEVEGLGKLRSANAKHNNRHCSHITFDNAGKSGRVFLSRSSKN